MFGPGTNTRLLSQSVDRGFLYTYSSIIFPSTRLDPTSLTVFGKVHLHKATHRSAYSHSYLYTRLCTRTREVDACYRSKPAFLHVRPRAPPFVPRSCP